METSSDPGMYLLMVAIEEGFPDTRRETDDTVAVFWVYPGVYPREHVVSDGAILFQDRVVIIIHPSLRTEHFVLPRECHRWNHVPVRSYSGRVYPPPFRRPEIDVAHATKQHRHRLRLLQRRLTRRRLHFCQFSRTSAITVDAIISSLVTVCRVRWTSTKRPRVHQTPELLASLPVFVRCSPLRRP